MLIFFFWGGGFTTTISKLFTKTIIQTNIINNEDRYINVYELKTRQYLVNLMYNSYLPDTGLHSMSTTK